MKLAKVVLVIGLILLIGTVSWAAETKRIASITGLEGTAQVSTTANTQLPAEVGMVLREGDTIRTGANSMARLSLDGNAATATVEVKQNSQLKMAQLTEDKQAATQATLLDLSLGEVLIHAKKLHSEKSRFEVKTPTSIVGVRGTTFSVTVEAVE